MDWWLRGYYFSNKYIHIYTHKHNTYTFTMWMRIAGTHIDMVQCLFCCCWYHYAMHTNAIATVSKCLYPFTRYIMYNVYIHTIYKHVHIKHSKHIYMHPQWHFAANKIQKHISFLRYSFIDLYYKLIIYNLMMLVLKHIKMHWNRGWCHFFSIHGFFFTSFSIYYFPPLTIFFYLNCYK